MSGRGAAISRWPFYLILKPGKLKKNGEIASFDPQVLLDTAGVERKNPVFRRSNSIYSQREAADTETLCGLA